MSILAKKKYFYDFNKIVGRVSIVRYRYLDDAGPYFKVSVLTMETDTSTSRPLVAVFFNGELNSYIFDRFY